MKNLLFLLITISGLLFAVSCSDDDNQNDADKLGVGAQCTDTSECDEKNSQECLTDFKGGYCGIVGCTMDSDCPDNSRCVAHTDGKNYCFRTCLDKIECNANRDVDNESNCSSSITFVEDPQDSKACIPPSN